MGTHFIVFHCPVCNSEHMAGQVSIITWFKELERSNLLIVLASLSLEGDVTLTDTFLLVVNNLIFLSLVPFTGFLFLPIQEGRSFRHWFPSPRLLIPSILGSSRGACIGHFLELLSNGLPSTFATRGKFCQSRFSSGRGFTTGGGLHRSQFFQGFDQRLQSLPGCCRITSCQFPHLFLGL